MAQPNQPQNPNQVVNANGAFDPDQFKQDVLNAVQQQLNQFGQNFAPPAQAQQQPQPQPVYGQPASPWGPPQAPGYYQQPASPWGPPVYQQPGYQQPFQPFPQQPLNIFQQAQQPQQMGLVPVQQQGLMPNGPTPTMDQLMQAMMILFQRQEQMMQEIQNMRNQSPQSPNNVVVSTPVIPYPYTGHHVDQYKWLVDFGLQYNMDGTARQVVTQQDIKNRRKLLDALEMRLSFSEYWELVAEHYHGIIFTKY